MYFLKVYKWQKINIKRKLVKYDIGIWYAVNSNKKKPDNSDIR